MPFLGFPSFLKGNYMYEIFEMLLTKKGVKTAEVCRATGIKSPVFSEWKKGKSCPNVDKLILIAKYFNVSVEYLRTGKEPETQRYDEELAEKDVALLDLSEEIKDCALRMSKLSEDRLNALLGVIKAHLDLEESR